MKHRSLPLFCFLLLITGTVIAQSNSMMDSYLLQDKALAAETSYFALVGAALMDDTVSSEEALAKAIASAWVKQGAVADTPLTVEDLSYLLMRAFKIKGGLMYTLFPSRRYALRELIARGIVNGSGGKNRIVSGEEALGIIAKAAAVKGGAK